MKLRTKVIVAVISTTICANAILIAIAGIIFTYNYRELEANAMSLDLARIANSIEDKISYIDTLTTDWSVSDDTYNFAEDRNEEYVKANYTGSTFEYLGINVIAIMNSSGEIILVKEYDLEKKAETPISSEIQSFLSNNYLAIFKDADNGYRGIEQLPAGPMLFASHPILTSEEEGPVHGTLIMGRYLDNKIIEQLSNSTRLPFSLRALTDFTEFNPKNEGTITISQDNPVLIRAKDENTLSGYKLLFDVYDNPCLVISLEMPRDIYSHGKELGGWFLAGMAIIALLIIFVILFFLDRSILSRLRYLGDSAMSIARQGDFSSRISLKGQDEISLLADQMNEMLSKLSDARNRL